MTNEQLPALAAAVAAELGKLRNETWHVLPANADHGAPRSLDLAQRLEAGAPEFEVAITLDWRGNGRRVAFDPFCRLVYQDERQHTQRITASDMRMERLTTSCDVEREPAAIARQVNNKIVAPFLAEQLPALREYQRTKTEWYETYRASLIEIAELTGNPAPDFERQRIGFFYDRLSGGHTSVEVRSANSIKLEHDIKSAAELAELLAVVRKFHPAKERG